jgi:hypothetical protein
MENKQSSIEWLFHKLWNEPKDKMVWYALLNKAKQMHKEERVEALNKLLSEILDNKGGQDE